MADTFRASDALFHHQAPAHPQRDKGMTFITFEAC